MKVARHAKEQSRKSKDALLAHALMAETLIRAKQAAKVRLLYDKRPMYWRLNEDKSVTPIYGSLQDQAMSFAAEWSKDRQLADTTVEGRRVSTVFLGLDHSFFDGPPILFETMVFSAETKMHDLFGEPREYHESLDMRRYATYAEAMQGHEEVVAETRAIVAQMNKALGDQNGQDQL